MQPSIQFLEINLSKYITLLPSWLGLCLLFRSETLCFTVIPAFGFVLFFILVYLFIYFLRKDKPTGVEFDDFNTCRESHRKKRIVRKGGCGCAT